MLQVGEDFFAVVKFVNLVGFVGEIEFYEIGDFFFVVYD